jgi:hypothetical protein
MKAAKGKSKPSGRKLAKGFDFGSPCPVLLPGATEWCADLHHAEITGCAYTWVSIPELRARIPGIALIARRVEPLRQAFEQFHRWSEGSDDCKFAGNSDPLRGGFRVQS